MAFADSLQLAGIVGRPVVSSSVPARRFLKLSAHDDAPFLPDRMACSKSRFKPHTGGRKAMLNDGSLADQGYVSLCILRGLAQGSAPMRSLVNPPIFTRAQAGSALAYMREQGLVTRTDDRQITSCGKHFVYAITGAGLLRLQEALEAGHER